MTFLILYNKNRYFWGVIGRVIFSKLFSKIHFCNVSWNQIRYRTFRTLFINIYWGKPRSKCSYTKTKLQNISEFFRNILIRYFSLHFRYFLLNIFHSTQNILYSFFKHQDGDRNRVGLLSANIVIYIFPRILMSYWYLLSDMPVIKILWWSTRLYKKVKVKSS